MLNKGYSVLGRNLLLVVEFYYKLKLFSVIFNIIFRLYFLIYSVEFLLFIIVSN